MAAARATIGVFGGSGFYSLLSDTREIWVETPYGVPSDKVALGEIAGKTVAFMPRHGRDHRFPPHAINYRANLWAMKELGVERIIGPSASGSLRRDIEPGHMVVADQVVDRTSRRADTFFDGPLVTHVSFADPYCPQMRSLAVRALRSLDIVAHDGGTIVVISGPRFSTRAESRWFQDAGWQVVNMTQYPECYLARELEMCYVSISLITDYDVGLAGVPAVTADEVITVLNRNNEKVKAAIATLVEAIPGERTCDCGRALAAARL